ncbi:alpha-amylase domain-containing protein [Spirochaeta africana]|uniref:Alpha-amylase n=1 Tax=Spirochaeta africana (strain ATCC 700263 / DSM 8902 / Z-7692) TaxID=889378 RepID=H9UHI9_SPIAZ|nr:alpha-amylase domain-containing protein [Spirochaeta africana]AFG36982.1 glycosidase [Spirochaeta africana DSM 8902]
MRVYKYTVIWVFLAFLTAACSNPLQQASVQQDDSIPQSRTAQGSLPNIPDHMVNDTMYQFFYWDSYPGLWSQITSSNTHLNRKAHELANAGITAVWLPPAAKGMAGGFSVGYDVYDFWDLGEFDQKGTVGTRYGTRGQLEHAVSYLSNLGIDSYYDVVFNHRMGADSQQYVPGHGNVWTNFDLQGRAHHYTQSRWGYLYHDIVWDWTAFNGIDGQLFPDKWWGNTFHDPYLMGNDVDYNRQDIRHEMKAWGEWIINDIGFAGFRMDAVAHVDSDFVRRWVNHVQWATDQDIFYVAEAWVNDVGGYLDHVGTGHLNAFDFSLRDDFVALSSGSKDMRWWGGLLNSPYGDRAVTFVDNHDTSREGNPYNSPQVINYKNQAYAYILMRDRGVPTVFARDYDEFGMAPTLKKLIEARRYFAYGPGHEYSGNQQHMYAYVREGLSDVPGTGLVMLLSGRDWGNQESYWINSRQPHTEFYDYTGNVSGTVTTNEHGYGNFPVNITEGTGWSIWVPRTNSLTDISGNWAINQISYLYQNNYIQGYPDGTYQPDGQLTRAEFAAFIASVLDPAAKPEYANRTFTDTSGHWAEQVILQAARAGYIAGYPDGTFRPQETLSKLHATIALANGLGMSGGNGINLGSYLTDAHTIPTWARGSVKNALANNLLVNYPLVNRFSPNVAIDRASIAALFYQVLVYQGTAPTLDSPYILTP